MAKKKARKTSARKKKVSTKRKSASASSRRKKTVSKKKTSKRSRITVPKESSTPSNLVAFRVDTELKRFLDKSGNKSETLNDALRQYFSHWQTCKTCNGTGLVRRTKLKK